MASERAIEQALRTLAQNYITIKNREEWIDGNRDLWVFHFSDAAAAQRKQVAVPDRYLLNGAADFCLRVPGDFPPNLNKFYQYLHKEYRLSEDLHTDMERDDCDECQKGIRLVALHMKSTSEVTGEDIVVEKFYHTACDCPAGQHHTSNGLDNWKSTEEKYGKNPRVVSAWMTHKHQRDLPPEALISEWRRNRKKRGKNPYLPAVQRLEQAAIMRDRTRIANGEKPIDRQEFIDANKEDYY